MRMETKSELKKALEIQDVIHFLTKHPDFLKENYKLLQHFLPYQDLYNSQSSLLKKENRQLKEKNSQLNDMIDQLIYNGYQHEKELHFYHQLYLKLLTAKTIKEIRGILSAQLKKHFSLVKVSLLLTDYNFQFMPINIKNIVQQRLAYSSYYFGLLHDDEARSLLHKDKFSFALIALKEKNNYLGLLVLSSLDVHFFSKKTDILFFRQLKSILSLQLKKFRVE